jgi:endonuclease G
MAVNLTRLEQAAGRFHTYAEKMQQADPDVLRAERVRVAARHREQFLPAAEKFAQLRSAAVASQIIDAAAETTPPGDLAVIEGGVIPEILQRDNDLRPVRYLQIALLAARSVGRVRVVGAAGDEEGDATGFLVAPGLLLTNWHVLKTRELAEASSIIFDDEDGIDGDPRELKVYRFLPQRLYVSDKDLDYAIVEVSPRTSSGTPLSQFGYLRLFEQTGKLDPTQRQAANVIQHPGGGPKKIAIRDNYFEQVLPDSVDPAREVNSVFYGSDMLKGPSGAPSCSDQWYVVALHRGGVPATKVVDGRRVAVRHDGAPALQSDPPDLIRYVTNEGTRVSRITLRCAPSRSRVARLRSRWKGLGRRPRPAHGAARPTHGARRVAGDALARRGRRRGDHSPQRFQVQGRKGLPTLVPRHEVQGPAAVHDE